MTIPTITTLPVAPARTDAPATFVTRADAFLAAIVVMQGELNTTIGAMNADIAGVNADAVTASDAATSASASAAAAQSASNATAWVSGQTYAAGATVYSLINYKSYRAITGTSGTTDPSASADWTALGYGLPSQSGNADKFLQTDGTNESWQDVPASGGTYTATSSGAIASGDKIVVNTDGTISAVSGVDNPNFAGAVGTFTTGTNYTPSVAYDKANDRVVVFYNKNGSLAAKAATLASDGTFTFGSEVTVYSASGSDTNVCYDENRGQVIFVYKKSNGFLQARSGTVDPSNNSIAVGTPSDNSQTTNGEQFFNAMVYNSNEQHIALAFWEYNTYRIVVLPLTLTGTVGVNTNISWGTYDYATPANQNSWYIDLAYDPEKEILMVFWRDDSNSNYATCRAGSWNSSNYYMFDQTETVVNSSATAYHRIIYSPVGKCFVAFYNDSNNNLKINPIVSTTARVVTVGTQYNTDSYALYTQVVNNTSANKLIVTYRDANVSSSGKAQAVTVDANQVVTWTDPFQYVNTNTDQAWHGAYDPDNDYVISAYADGIVTSGEVVAIRAGNVVTNLTQNNWIGVSNAAYADGVSAEIKSRGSIVTNSTFKDTSTVSNVLSRFGPWTYDNNLVYDSNSDRYLLTYRDNNNSGYFTGVVIQISVAGTVTVGTPQVISSQGSAQQSGVAFDSNLNKFFICFRDGSSYGYGLVAVINPANNSATYGTPTEFTRQSGEATYCSFLSCAFDTNSNKFCMTYQSTSPDTGACRVAYINDSTNTVTFGAEHQYYSAAYGQLNAVAFDPNLNKFINAYAIGGNGSVNAITLVIDSSANTISSGTSLQIATGFGGSMGYGPQIAYNSTAQKFVIVYTKSGGAGIAAVTASITDSSNAVVLGTITDFDGSFYAEITEGADSTVYVASRGGDGSNPSSYQQLTINGTNLTSGGLNTYHTSTVAQSAYNAVIYVGGRLTIVVDYYYSNSESQWLYTFSFERAIQPATPYFVDYDGTISSVTSDYTVPMGTGLNSTTIFTKGV